MADPREAARETEPSGATVAAEESEAQRAHVADREATEEEREDAEQAPRDPDAGAHFEEMAKRGANQQGEGRVP